MADIFKADHAEAVRLIGRLSAEAYDEGDTEEGYGLLSALIHAYVRQIPLPVSRDWSTMPRLDGIVSDMEATYSASGMRAAEDVIRFRREVSLRFAWAFARAVPSLSAFMLDPRVCLSAIQVATTTLMLERDRHLDARATRHSNLVSRVLSGFRSNKGSAEAFLDDTPGESVRFAIANSARSLGEIGANGVLHGVSADDLDYLVRMAETHPGETSERVMGAIVIARRFANTLHVARDR